MNVKKCVNGHFFDADKYQACPVCGDALEGSAPVQAKPEPAKKSLPFFHKKQEERAARKESPRTQNPAPQDSDKTWGRMAEPEQDQAMPAYEEPARYEAPAARSQNGVPVGRDTGMKCPKCGEPYLGIGKFCTACGAPLSFQDDQTQSAMVMEGGPDRAQLAGLAAMAVAAEREILPPEPPRQYQDAAPAPDYREPAYQREAAPQPQRESQAESSFQSEVRSAKASSEGRTIGFFSAGAAASPAVGGRDPQSAAEPTVGWLVCVKGKHFGESFAITFGRNSVGRGASNKIVLNRDNTVSREKHAWITYEPKRRDFFIQPGESSGLSYLNGETVMESRRMNPRDTVEFGEGVYLLVPLCGPDFSWDEYIN